jgi:hypothetical protein
MDCVLLTINCVPLTVRVYSKASTVKCIDLERMNKADLLFIDVSTRNAACCMSESCMSESCMSESCMSESCMSESCMSESCMSESTLVRQAEPVE